MLLISSGNKKAKGILFYHLLDIKGKAHITLNLVFFMGLPFPSAVPDESNIWTCTCTQVHTHTQTHTQSISTS